MKNKKKNKIFLLVILLLGLSIGFAALATTLKINGSATITKNTWNIYWDNIANEDGVTPETETIIESEDANHPNNIVTFEVEFDKPGDYYEFTVDAVNAGTLDAEILSIEKKYNNTLIPAVEDPEHRVVPAYLKYEVTYADDTLPTIGDGLAKAQDLTSNPPVYTTKTYKIRVEYDRDAVTNADINNQVGNVTHEFSFKVDYGQATGSSSNQASYTIVSGDIDTPGSEVCLGEECFYVVGNEGANKVKLFAKYPIKTAEKYVNDEDFNRQYNSYTSEDGMKFSNEAYWFDNDEYQIKPKYSQVDIFETYGETHYVYDENSLLYPHVSNYAQILSNQGFDVTARLISLKELTDFYACDVSYDNFSCSGPNGNNDVSNNIAIWLGNEEELTYIWMYSAGGGAGTNYDIWWNNGLAVRPLVIIDK